MGEPAILHLRFPIESRAEEKCVGGPLPSIVAFCQATTPHWDIKPEGVYLDLTGTGRLLGWGTDGPARVCRRAGQDLGVQTGGAGPTLLAARLASLLTVRLGAQGLFIVPVGSVQAFLASFPVGVLEDHPSQVRRLRELGVRTLGDLQRVPPALLKAVFGNVADDLLAEAVGSAPVSFAQKNATVQPAELVAGASLTRPLTSAAGHTALLDALALRAMAGFSEGPASCQSWQLRSRLTGQRHLRTSLCSDEAGTLGGWRRMLRKLWERLPIMRQGITNIELWCCPRPGKGPRQGLLFPADERARRLAEVLGRINGSGHSGVCTGSAQLLSRWGIRWYGPGTPGESHS